jgi:hypothetical protein
MDLIRLFQDSQRYVSLNSSRLEHPCLVQFLSAYLGMFMPSFLAEFLA